MIIFLIGIIGQVFWNIHKFEPRKHQVTNISHDIVSFRRCCDELFRLDNNHLFDYRDRGKPMVAGKGTFGRISWHERVKLRSNDNFYSSAKWAIIQKLIII